MQDKDQLKIFVDELSDRMFLGAVVGIGAGRMGYALRGFIMRLSHMGGQASFIGDTNVPSVDSSSTVIMNSSSGETPTNIIYARQARQAGAKLFLLTQNPCSTIGKMADVVIALPSVESHQVMKTFSEQYTALLLDYLVTQIIPTTSTDISVIADNHSIFE